MYEDEMVSYIHTNLPVNTKVRLPHPQSGDSQCRETLLAPSADNQTRNYNTECSNQSNQYCLNQSVTLNLTFCKIKRSAIQIPFISSEKSGNNSR